MDTKKPMRKIKIVSIILLSVSLLIIGYNESIKKNQKEIDNKMINKFFKPEITQEKELKSNQSNEDYIAIVEIPKISLKTGLVEKNSKNNTVEKHIQILEQSTMPNESNSTLILAAHSGNSNVSYFKNLYKLNIEDNVNIYYKNIKYIYQISNIRKETKNGKITIINTNTPSLIMTTCDKENDKQLIVEAKLKEKATY